MVSPSKIDRQQTPPFYLRLFYKHGAFHSMDDFDPALRAPAHLEIYTWLSCSLDELSLLLCSALPEVAEKPWAGHRIAFRLVYPDDSVCPGARARFLSRDLGSVVVGAKDLVDEDEEMNGAENGTVRAFEAFDPGEPEKTLADANFEIGDYVSCAILPPLPDNTIQPPPVAVPSGPSRGPPPPRDSYGMRGGGSRDYGNGYGGGGRDYGYGRGGRGGRFDDRDRRGPGVPPGEWRRGEAPPENDAPFWRGSGSGGRPYGRGRGGRW